MPPNSPSNAHGFAMRSMSLRDMQIHKSEKQFSWPPPPKSWGRPCVVFNFNSTLAFIDSSTCPSNKVNCNWTKATDKDILDYSYLTSIYCKNIHVVDVVKCVDVNCKSHEHVEQIDQLYSQLCSVLKCASDDSYLNM